MVAAVSGIPVTDLLWVLIPVVGMITIQPLWSVRAGAALYALARMLLQLILIGYALTYPMP